MSFLLSIDQCTSGTKALIVDGAGQAIAKGATALQSAYFGAGFVEQDPEAIYQNVLLAVEHCLQDFASSGFNQREITAIGISNQRETFVIWDEQGQAMHPAVVWQCKRSVEICDHLKKNGWSDTVYAKTGLVIDPYFSATKLIWLAQNNPDIKEAIQAGRAFFGTIDSWLLYRLTGGVRYATDHTNASRTLFFNIHTLSWDLELIEAFGLQGLQLPSVQSASGYFGDTTVGDLLKHSVPIMALIGDSHAAAFGEGCFDPGTAKATLGTGSSILMNIGDRPVTSRNGMVTTICWSIPGRVDYALEGVIVTCGATIEWLKNEMGFFKDIQATAGMAFSVPDNGGVYLVPAFSGLGSPHWQMERKASITGMTFATTKNHIVRAALESIPYQIKDVIAAMEKDTALSLKQLMTNGGLSSNAFVMPMLSDLLHKPVSRSRMADVSALGAAYMAGLASGLYADIDALRRLKVDKEMLLPAADVQNVQACYQEWLRVVNQNDNEQ